MDREEIFGNTPPPLHAAANLAAAVGCQVFAMRQIVGSGGDVLTNLQVLENLSVELQQTIRALQDAAGNRVTIDRGDDV